MLVAVKTACEAIGRSAIGAAGWRTHSLLDDVSAERARGLLAFDFDDQGPAAAAIADRCQMLRMADPELPIYCQSGTYAELTARGMSLNAVVNLDEVARRVLGSAAYVSTGHIAATVRSIAGAGTPLEILAHGAHLRRTVLACQAQGLSYTLDLNSIHAIPWNEWASAQCWTRRQMRAVWWPREFALLTLAEMRSLPEATNTDQQDSTGGAR